METRITPNRVFRWHLSVILALGILNLIPAIGDLTGHADKMGPFYLIRLSAEGNFPTFFSALALLGCAVLAFLLHRSPFLKGIERRGWLLAAALFVLVAMDEQFVLHEKLNGLADKAGITGALRYVGPFPYVLLLLALMPILWRFFWNQSRRVQIGLALGGGIYVASAVGMEMIEIPLRMAQVPEWDIRRVVLFAVEELGEMLGVAILLRTFLLRFAELGPGGVLTVGIVPDSQAQARESAAVIPIGMRKA